jgi:hypothetical protein
LKEVGLDCPKCKLVNPPGTRKCDCGFNFENEEMESPSGEFVEGRQANRRLKWLIIAAVIGTFVLLVLYLGSLFALSQVRI